LQNRQGMKQKKKKSEKKNLKGLEGGTRTLGGGDSAIATGRGGTGRTVGATTRMDAKTMGGFFKLSHWEGKPGGGGKIGKRKKRRENNRRSYNDIGRKKEDVGTKTFTGKFRSKEGRKGEKMSSWKNRRQRTSRGRSRLEVAHKKAFQKRTRSAVKRGGGEKGKNQEPNYKKAGSLGGRGGNKTNGDQEIRQDLRGRKKRGEHS